MQDIQYLLDQWGDAFRQGSSEKLVQLYAADASLWGTMSDIQRIEHEAISDYFDSLFNQYACDITFGDGYFRQIDNLIVAAGTYNFVLKNDKFSKMILPARYSFVFQKVIQGWKIIEHHSSVMPNTII